MMPHLTLTDTTPVNLRTIFFSPRYYRLAQVCSVGFKRLVYFKTGYYVCFTHHIKIICSGSASLYAIRTLKAHGASVKDLQTITRATTISRTMYTSPAWWGLASSRDKTRLECFMNRIRRAGYLK